MVFEFHENLIPPRENRWFFKKLQSSHHVLPSSDKFTLMCHMAFCKFRKDRHNVNLGRGRHNVNFGGSQHNVNSGRGRRNKNLGCGRQKVHFG